MATTFPIFEKLPSELRAWIWNQALFDEYGRPDHCKRIIEFHDYDIGAATMSITVSRKYPIFFSVNREARYEAAKVDGGEWMAIFLRTYDEYGEYVTEPGFEVYINFLRDPIFLSERFTTTSAEHVWLNARISIEHFRLEMLRCLLREVSINKIQKLQLTATRPPEERRLENRAWWRGETLERFSSLKSLAHVCNEHRFAIWLRYTLIDLFEESWKTTYQTKDMPKVKTIFYTGPKQVNPDAIQRTFVWNQGKLSKMAVGLQIYQMNGINHGENSELRTDYRKSEFLTVHLSDRSDWMALRPFLPYDGP